MTPLPDVQIGKVSDVVAFKLANGDALFVPGDTPHVTLSARELDRPNRDRAIEYSRAAVRDAVLGRARAAAESDDKAMTERLRIVSFLRREGANAFAVRIPTLITMIECGLHWRGP